MEFNVKVLQNRKSLGLRSIGADSIIQAESGLLQIIQEYLVIKPSEVRWYYEVKAEELRKILFYAKVKNGKEIKLRIELKLLTLAEESYKKQDSSKLMH